MGAGHQPTAMKLLLAIMVLFLLSGSAWAQTLVPPFPGSPTANQEVIGPDGQVYVWDGTKWVHGAGTPALITDAALASAYSGIGSCTANQFVTALTRNTAPTCAAVSTLASGATLNNLTLTGTVTLPAASIADAALTNGYGGIGACIAGSAAIQLNRNATPTCSPFLPVNNPTYTGLLTGPRALLTDANAAVLFNSATTPFASITAPTSSTLQLASGAHFNGTNWIADATYPTIIEQNDGALNFYTNRGLTAGNTFTPGVFSSMARSTPPFSGGLSMWEFDLNLIGPLIQVQNHANSPNWDKAAAGFNAIAINSGVTPGLQHNFWLLNRGYGYTGASQIARADSALIQTEDAGGLIINTFTPAGQGDIWIQSGNPDIGGNTGGGIWLQSGDGGGLGIGPGNSMGVIFPPAWRNSMSWDANGAYVEHLQNDYGAGTPTVTGGTLQAGSRDTFGNIVKTAAAASNITLQFSRPFLDPNGSPTMTVCTLTSYGAFQLWWDTAQNAYQVTLACYDFNVWDDCAPGSWVEYHCAGLGSL